MYQSHQPPYLPAIASQAPYIPQDQTGDVIEEPGEEEQEDEAPENSTEAPKQE